MSTFQSNSRYLKYAALTEATDRRGRVVACLTPARLPPQVELGKHRRKDGQRLDHLAEHYLGDATLFWRVAFQNDAMTADQIAAAGFISIPVKGS